MKLLSSLNREQKESIGLLQVGTIFEYFDLMLYIHMAVLLNELFFPKYDPLTTSILTAATFCSTYVFRPIGALIIGQIGDRIGRKPTIIITTVMMAVSCLVMANLPTYDQIGITAAWIMLLCRVAQSISSMGEIVAAQIYLTETIQRPACYPVTTLLEASANLGALLALGIAFFITSSGLSWRYAFWFGALIAAVGAFARVRLRETSEFIKMERQWMKEEVQKTNLAVDSLTDTDEGAVYNTTWKEPVRPKTLLSYFFITCGWPLCMYIVYFYFNPLLKESFGYSPADIVRHNFFLTLISLIFCVFLAYFSYSIHPLKINKIRGILFISLIISLPFLLMGLTSSTQLFLIQALILSVGLNDVPSTPVFMSHFPLYRRVTFASFLWSLSRASIFVVTSFGLVFLGSYFGHFGLWIISLPTACAFLYGINHFIELQRERRVYNKSIPPL